MSTSQAYPRKTAAIFTILFILIMFLAAAQCAHAGPEQQEPDAAPTVKVDTEGTPALLLTPLAEETSAGEGSGMRPLVLTVLLLMCGMVGMLVGGIGIAMIMVRVRNRIKGE